MGNIAISTIVGTSSHNMIIHNATMALLDMIVKTSVRHAKRLLVNDSMEIVHMIV